MLKICSFVATMKKVNKNESDFSNNLYFKLYVIFNNAYFWVYTRK